MKYTPRHNTPEELLLRAGYRSGPNRGFVRITKHTEDNYYQFHAIVSGDEIDLHRDSPNGRKRHQASKTGRKVEEEMEKLKQIDVPEKLSDLLNPFYQPSTCVVK